MLVLLLSQIQNFDKLEWIILTITAWFKMGYAQEFTAHQGVESNTPLKVHTN